MDAGGNTKEARWGVKMIWMQTILDVADNTGAKKAACIGVIGRSGKRSADIGDIITCNIKEASPDAAIKKGEAECMY